MLIIQKRIRIVTVTTRLHYICLEKLNNLFLNHIFFKNNYIEIMLLQLFDFFHRPDHQSKAGRFIWIQQISL